MKNQKRTPKETANAIAYTVSSINNVLKAVPILDSVDLFNLKKFKEVDFDQLVTSLCKKNKVDELHIRKVGDWV